MGIVDEKYFIALRNACKDRFRMIGYFIGEKLIAFSSTLEHQEKLEVHYIGLDYTYNKSHALYFNILFDGIEQAILSEKKSWSWEGLQGKRKLWLVAILFILMTISESETNLHVVL
ncbi:MAG: hypothetical protein IPF81_10230 [Bacteroidetes bacterium]|nr:hypothetical protein [Bacteroidota bacterium]